MMIDRKGVLHGHPVVAVRNALRDQARRNGGGTVTVDGLSRSLRTDRAAALRLCDELARDGHLIPGHEIPGPAPAGSAGEDWLDAWALFSGRRPEDYVLTVSGSALSMAALEPGITRATAERNVAELLVRTREVNADPLAVWKVHRLDLFGSFLDPSRGRLGDVDVAIELRTYRELTEEENSLLYARQAYRLPHEPGEVLGPDDVVRRLRRHRPTLNFVDHLRQGLWLATVPTRPLFRAGDAPPLSDA